MRLHLAACAAALALFIPSAIAGTPETIRDRIAGYRAMGAAFKAINDTLRTDAPDLRVVRRGVRAINMAAHHQYRWFPAGSGPESGQRTKAKAEIWSNAAGFRTAQDGFAAQARILAAAARTGDMTAIRAEGRKLGGTCKQCHDQFRTAND